MNVLSATGAATGSDATTTRTSSRDDSAQNGGFDTLLQSKPASSSSTQAKQASKGTERSPHKPDAAKDSPSEAEELQPTAKTEDSESTQPAEKEATEDAPWPPFGLSALVTAPAPPPPPAPAPPPTAADPTATPTTPVTQGLPATTAPLAAAAVPARTATDTSIDANAVLPEATTLADKAGNDIPVDADGTPQPTAFGQLLHAQNLQEARATSAAARIDAPTPTPTPDLHSDDFDDAIGARVSWLADQKIGHAQIRITPHDLGQVDVKLQLDGDRVHASFSSAHADVRQALESSLPRLREMLGEQGLQLAHADVGQQAQQQQSEARADSPGFTTQQDHPELTTTPQTLRMRGLLDAYA